MPEDSVSGEGLLSGLQIDWSLCLHMVDTENSLVSLLKGPSLIMTPPL